MTAKFTDSPDCLGHWFYSTAREVPSKFILVPIDPDKPVARGVYYGPVDVSSLHPAYWERKLDFHSGEAILGNESGFRRLGDWEVIQDGDETFDSTDDSLWVPATRREVGMFVGVVGEYGIWRRKTK